MPLEDFLAGAVLFALMLLAVLAATALDRRSAGSRTSTASSARLAAIVVGTAVLIGVHLVPLLLGILDRATVLAAAVLAVALATRVQRRDAPARPRTAGRRAAPSGRARLGARRRSPRRSRSSPRSPTSAAGAATRSSASTR